MSKSIRSSINAKLEGSGRRFCSLRHGPAGVGPHSLRVSGQLLSWTRKVPTKSSTWDPTATVPAWKGIPASWVGLVTWYHPIILWGFVLRGWNCCGPAESGGLTAAKREMAVKLLLPGGNQMTCSCERRRHADADAAESESGTSTSSRTAASSA